MPLTLTCVALLESCEIVRDSDATTCQNTPSGYPYGQLYGLAASHPLTGDIQFPRGVRENA